MRVGVFHPGTQHSWQTALAFQEAGMLSWFATSIFYDPSRWPYKLDRVAPKPIAERLSREFSRRYHPALSIAKVRQCGLWEWTETLLRRSGQLHLARLCNQWGNRAFCRQVIRLVEREPVDVLWGFDTSSLEVFTWARKRGIYCVLDQTIGHPASQNREMLQEQDRHPEFFESSYQPHSSEWIDRQNAEIEAADLVLVGSEYCARTMLENGCPPSKLRVVPYGYDAQAISGSLASPGPVSPPVRCLFVGEVGPRKGAAYLLPAFAELAPDKVQLTLVGRLAIPVSTFQKYQKHVRHIPQVPRHEVLQYFRGADCFVFPSLFEGSAMVLYEACGSGLGIIATDRCGDGLRPGQNGMALEQLSVANLVTAIEGITRDPTLLERWQQGSRDWRSERTWGNYRQTVAQLVRDA
jgi:glycosyltransferase involved in cell wall biosynthesis